MLLSGRVAAVEAPELEEVTTSDLQELERFVDSMLQSFGVDFEFTRHFEERANHPRNNPRVTKGELRDFFQKVINDNAEKIRKNPDSDRVLKDMQTQLNLPVSISRQRDDSLKVTLKTVMRKRDYRTRDPFIKY